MKQITQEQYFACLEAQTGIRSEAKVRCPSCKTETALSEWADAGVPNQTAFSCIGRTVEGKGCNWTLGGLFQIHTLEVSFPDGTKTPAMEPINLRQFLEATQ